MGVGFDIMTSVITVIYYKRRRLKYGFGYLLEKMKLRYNKNRYTIKCRLCESYKTKLKTNGEPIWIKDKNSRGEWTNKFICYNCAYENDKSCHKCGNDTDKYNTKYYE